MFSNIIAGAAGFPVADLGDTVNHSLRFRGAQQLAGPAYSGTTTSGTFSFWLKIAGAHTEQMFIMGYVSSAANGAADFMRRAQSSYDNRFDQASDAASTWNTSGAIRDPSAWYHIFYRFDSNGPQVYINGVRDDDGVTTAMSLAQNGSNPIRIGNNGAGTSSDFLKGYLADFHYIDGTAVGVTSGVPDEFGRYNDDGVWVPKNYTGSYGTNGFHLTFDSSQTEGIGHDSSGNGNHFTPSGFDTSAISSTNTDNDIDIPDSPSSPNYPTYNSPACHSSQTLSNANLATSASSYTFAPATISIPADCGKKFYWEVTVTNVSGNPTMGMTDPTQRVGQGPAYSWVWAPTLEDIESDQGNILNLVDTGVSTINTSSGTTYMFAYDADTQNVWIGDNGNWYKRDGAAGVGDPGAGTNPFLTTSDACVIDGNTYAPCTAGSSAGTTAYEINFGQFNFQHTAPTGFVDLNSANLPEPTIKTGSDHFDVIVAPGDAASSIGSNEIEVNTYTNPSGYLNNNPPRYYTSNAFDGSTSTYFYVPNNTSGVTPAILFDEPMEGTTFEIYASVNRGGFYINGTYRSGNSNSAWLDISSEVGGSLESLGFIGAGSASDGFSGLKIDNNTVIERNVLTQAQTKFSDGLYWIKDIDNSNDHQLVDTVRGTTAHIKKCPGLSNSAAYSQPSGDAVAWCWNAPDVMDQATREAGSINVTAGRVNQTAGFSIIEFEGNTTSGATVAHGLTQAPEFIIAIAQDNTNSIPVWHHEPDNTSLLNGNGAFSLTHVQAVSNSLVTISSNTAINTNTCSMYCWHSVEGYSKVGSYVGNGSNDGSFVYLGFRPRWLLFKGDASSCNWEIQDSTRCPDNPMLNVLYPNRSDSETGNDTANAVDFLANGFKLRNNASNHNQNGRTFRYIAFAENPFVGENFPPATAR